MKEILSNNPYFSDLTETEVKKIKEIMVFKKYNKDEVIFFEGEKGEGLFIVKSGKVKLVKMEESGREQILHILKKGNIFSEVILFERGEYPATALAMQDSEVGLIKNKKMEKLIEENP